MLLFGYISLIIGLLLAFVHKEPHFYAPFSLGLMIVLHDAYARYSGRSLFKNWNWRSFTLYLSLLLVFSVISDRIGIALGYWYYPAYSSFFDYVVQYTLEFTVALLYIMLAFMIGVEFFGRRGFRHFTASILSLITFSVATGLATEFLNSYAESWIVIDMPFSDIRIGEYWLVFVTLGYWILSLVPYLLYRLFAKRIEKNPA